MISYLHNLQAKIKSTEARIEAWITGSAAVESLASLIEFERAELSQIPVRVDNEPQFHAMIACLQWAEGRANVKADLILAQTMNLKLPSEVQEAFCLRLDNAE